MRKLLYFLGSLFLSLTWIAGHSQTQIVIPGFKDKYCDYVKKLEAGQTDIDYRDFRYSFIDSEQFKIASAKSSLLDSLEKKMFSLMNQADYQEIIRIAKAMLSIDYTSLIAHKILRQTLQLIGDTANARKYKTIQFGLLNSIVRNGNGKTCATAWPVIQLSEEYFILRMLGAVLKRQSLEQTGGFCDKMEVTTNEGDKTFYFEVTKVFEGYRKLGRKE